MPYEEWFLPIAGFITCLAAVIMISACFRKKTGTEAAGKGSDEKFRVLFEYSSDAHMIIAEHGIIDCNNAAVEILRCRDKSHLLSLQLSAFSPEFQGDGSRSAEKSMEMHRIARRRGYHRFEWLHRRMDGEDFPVEVTLSPIVIGGEVCLMAIWHDITEQKNYRLTLEKLHALTINKDLSLSNKIELMLELGAAYLKADGGMVGAAPSDIYQLLYSWPGKGIKLPLGSSAWLKTIKFDQPVALYDSAELAPEQHSLLKALGIESYIGAPIYVDGGFFGSLSFIGGASRSKPHGEYEINFIRLAAGWIGNEIARDRAAKMKNEFVAMVSHELRTPLTSIHGSLGLLTDDAMGKLPEKAKNMIDIAYRNCERLVGLINDILDTEKMEAGSMRFEIAAAELGDVLRQAVEANQGLSAKYNIRFRLSNELPGAAANIDSGRFIQAVTNLLSNAAKFSSTGGTVDVSVSAFGENARIAVRDYGPGIPEEFIPRIFQKFAQADSRGAGTKGGTGLGLNIAREMVEKMGGKIGFETAAGKGTVFYIDLPRIKSAALEENEKIRKLA